MQQAAGQRHGGLRSTVDRKRGGEGLGARAFGGYVGKEPVVSAGGEGVTQAEDAIGAEGGMFVGEVGQVPVAPGSGAGAFRA